jgi:glutathione synthase/RimK-type ligase-like ATP-grasp enzyme
MASKVLILSSQEDVHATRVEHLLLAHGVKTQFWRFDPFVHDCQLNFSISDNQNVFQFCMDNAPVDMSSFDSIWFRRPGTLQSKKFFQPWIEEMMIVEARQALLGMLYALPCLWVNYPGRDTTATLKLFQLQVAKNVGMTLPETIVTNDPVVARAFYEKFKGNVIYKLISEISNFSLPSFEFPHGIPTLPLREVDLNHLDQVKHAPHLFQQRVDKQSDIRVTVIGTKVFATHIESQKGSGKLDWRNDYSVPMTEWKLPDDLSEQCIEMLKALGLNYGAFDFCLDKNGRYVFLEVNPAGQYLWVEERTKQPLSEEMALLLAGKSMPLVDYNSAAFGDRTKFIRK